MSDPMEERIFVEHTCLRCGCQRGIVAIPGPHMIPFSLRARCQRCGSNQLEKAQLVTFAEFTEIHNAQI